MSFYKNAPRPKGWSHHFPVIGPDEKFTCPCGKLNVTYNSISSHSVICDKITDFFEDLAKTRRKGLLRGPRVNLSKFYHSREECDNKREQYLRVIKKVSRRNHCEYCGKFFHSNSIHTRSCSKECSYKLMVSKRDYAESTVRSVATRIANGNNSHPAWNKGLSGDEYLSFYKKEGETLDETKARMISGFFQKTKLEEAMEGILQELGIPFKNSIFVARRQFDFKLLDNSILIEVDGDYWHGNISVFGENLKEFQIENQKQDRIKDKLAFTYGYTILRFWESDVHSNPEEVKELIKRAIDKDEEAIRKIEINYTNKGGEHIRCYCARQASIDS